MELVVALEQIRDAALTGLAVHTNDRLVRASYVARIDRQIRHFPEIAFAPRRESLLDRVLVRSRERRKHEIADVRMPWMNRELIAVLHGARRFVDVREVELGVHALRVEIQRKRHDVDVSCALAVSEQ